MVPKTKKRKAAKPRQKVGRRTRSGVMPAGDMQYWMGTFVFISLLCALFTAFLSIQLAFMVLGAMALAGFAFQEFKQRRFWETSHDFKIKDVLSKHDSLVREVARNQSDIKSLKEGLTKTAETIERQNTVLKAERYEQQKEVMEITRKLKETAQRPRPSLAGYQAAEILDLETSPRAQRPAAVPRPAPGKRPLAIANDGPRDEDVHFSDMVIREMIHQAIAKKSIDVFAQPIVNLPQRKIRCYEMFARIRAKPGLYIPASRYMHIATRDQSIRNIDALLLMNCLDTIAKSAHIENATPFFLNINSDTLGNALFMKSLLSFVKRNRSLAKRLVFEVEQSDFREMHPAMLEILRGLGRLGCRLSLDHVEKLDFDIPFLQEMRVRYIKINAHTFIKKARSSIAFRELLKLKRRLEANGVAVIVEKVESEYVLKEILDFDIHYGQGFLFGKPELQGVYKEKKAA